MSLTHKAGSKDERQEGKKRAAEPEGGALEATQASGALLLFVFTLLRFLSVSMLFGVALPL